MTERSMKSVDRLIAGDRTRFTNESSVVSTGKHIDRPPSRVRAAAPSVTVGRDSQRGRRTGYDLVTATGTTQGVSGSRTFRPAASVETYATAQTSAGGGAR